jgi:hypothetical protein
MIRYEHFKKIFDVKEGELLSYSKAAFVSAVIATIGTNPFWVTHT